MAVAVVGEGGPDDERGAVRLARSTGAGSPSRIMVRQVLVLLLHP
jgi:hypothetical protein